MVEIIRAIEPPIMDSIELDKNILGGTTSRYFTIFSLFDLTAGTSTQVHMNHYSLIWKLVVSERMCNFIWMIDHNGIKNNKYLSQLKLREPFYDECTDEE